MKAINIYGNRVERDLKAFNSKPGQDCDVPFLNTHLLAKHWDVLFK